MKCLCILLCCIALLPACKKEMAVKEAPRPARQDGLWPLALQNEWTYKRTFYEPDGKEESSFSGEQIKITDTLNVRGQLYFRDKQTGYTLTNVGMNSVRGIAMDSSLTDPFAIVFQRVYSNDSTIWRMTDGACAAQESAFQGFGALSNVNGYECLKNERSGRNCNGALTMRYVTYLKPGVGMVRQEEYVPGPNGLVLRVTVDLLSYKLN
ncbi:MAG TPA: hypothetical protein VGE66_06915 [Chitinophagaceae bacterium]